jgi:LysR family glycine cleavage system transcriptional activator
MRSAKALMTAMARDLPPIRALEAFEAAMRHKSFTRAAAELSLTQGAISHQIRLLEAHLGLPLFFRSPTGIEPTGSASAFLPFVEDALRALRGGQERLARAAAPGVLTVSVSPSFAAKWLVPRLGRFLRAQPSIDLRLGATFRHVDLAADGIDMAIRHGDGRWPGLEVERLADELYLPVCAPGLVASLHRPGDLAAATLLHDRDRTRWAAWLGLAGVEQALAERGPVLDQASLVIDAAVAGDGVALARTSLAALDLAAGRLAVPFGPPLRGDRPYWVLSRPAARRRPDVKAFRAWLLAEAAADAKALDRARPEGAAAGD